MANTIRVVAWFSAVGALLATAAGPANAAPLDTGRYSPAPTALHAELHYGDLSGSLDASRVGTGPATVCLHLSKITPQRDGSTRYDVIDGCEFEAPQDAYSFAPLQWRGAVSVNVAADRRFFVERADGTFSAVTSTPIVPLRVDVRWTGAGDAEVRRSVGTNLAFPPVYARATASKRATTSGSVAFGADRVRLTGGPGTMTIGF